MLEDATGRRLRRMRLVGRSVAILVFLWLVVVVLGGIGVGPASRIPFGHLLRPTAGPPPLSRAVHVAQPTASELRPALSARAYAARRHAKAAAGSAAVGGQAKAAQNAARRAVKAAARRAARIARRGRVKGRATSAPGHVAHPKPTKTTPTHTTHTFTTHTKTTHTKTTPSNGHTP